MLHAIDLPEAIVSLAASPRRGLVAAGGAGGTAFLLDGTAASWRGLRGHAHAVQAAAFAADGLILVSAARGTMLQWSVGDC